MFADATCQSCSLRSHCIKGTSGRTISIQPEERLQQQARAHNQTEAGQRSLRQRVVVEHRIARLVRLGARQSRYFGKTKTSFQVVMAAVVANLSLVVGYCRQKLNSTTNTTVDPVSQTLQTSADASMCAKNGFLADIWSALVRHAHSLRQMASWAPHATPIPHFSY